MRKIAVMLAVLFCSTSVFAQTLVKGRVTDSKDGSPISGATIKVKGEKTSTTSNAEGVFEITAKPGSTLEVTEVGHAPRTVKSSAGSGELQVVLSQDARALSEIVVP